jgi:hypothetical protein
MDLRMLTKTKVTTLLTTLQASVTVLDLLDFNRGQRMVLEIQILRDQTLTMVLPMVGM